MDKKNYLNKHITDYIEIYFNSTNARTMNVSSLNIPGVTQWGQFATFNVTFCGTDSDTIVNVSFNVNDNSKINLVANKTLLGEYRLMIDAWLH